MRDNPVDDVGGGERVAAVDDLELALTLGLLVRIGAVDVSHHGRLAVDDHVDAEVAHELLAHRVGRADDHLVDVLAGEYAERALVHVHDGVILALVAIDDRVGVEADDEIVAVAFGLLEEVQQADVEEIERAGRVHDAIGWLGLAARRELYDLVGGGEELTRLGPGTARARLRGGAHLGRALGTRHARLVELVVRLGEQEHAADEVGGGDALGARDLLVALGALHDVIGVEAVGGERDVVAVHAKVARVLVERLERGHVGRVLDNLVDPLDAAHHLVAFVFAEDGRTLVFADLGVRVHADDETVAERLGLATRVRVAEVHHVEAAVAPHAHLAFRCRCRCWWHWRRHGAAAALRGWRILLAAHFFLLFTYFVCVFLLSIKNANIE